MRQAWRRALIGVAAAGLTGAGCIPDPPAQTVVPPQPAADAPQAQADAPVPTADSKTLLQQVDALKDQLKDKPRDFNVDVALGNLFYDNGRYIEAIEYFSDALTLAKPAEDRLRQLAEQKAFPVKTAVPDGCRADKPEVPGQKTRALESVAQAAQALEAKDAKGAQACWGQLVPMVAGVRARRGNSWYLVGNTDKARIDHDAALALDADHPEALFFEGALVLESAHGDKAKLDEGKRYWERLLKVAPDHPRANIVRATLPRVDELFGAHGDPMAAHDPHGGQTAQNDDPHAGMGEAAPGPAPLAPETMQAMQNVQHTPEMDANLDKTIAQAEAFLDQGQWQQALDTAKQVMPLRPDGRTALAMGIALRELGKPMAERVLSQAARMPGGNPVRAKYELGVLYEKTDTAQAKQLFGEVATDATWGPKAKARLAKLQ